MALTVKLPKRVNWADLEEVMGTAALEKFQQRWAAHHVGFHKAPHLTSEGMDLVLEILSGERTRVKSPELNALGAAAITYWIAVPNAKFRFQHWAKLYRSSMSPNGQKAKRPVSPRLIAAAKRNPKKAQAARRSK